MTFISTLQTSAVNAMVAVFTTAIELFRTNILAKYLVTDVTGLIKNDLSTVHHTTMNHVTLPHS